LHEETLQAATAAVKIVQPSAPELISLQQKSELQTHLGKTGAK
jgi:hypothetical protein